MNNKILIPDFSTKEPNLISTRRKNKEGKCCFHHCNNPLPKNSKEEYPYMGFLACKICGKKLQEEMKKWQEESFIEHFKEIITNKD